MTLLAGSVPISPGHVRIAITSPDILARIREVFAGKNLAVDFVRLPYVEVAVRPAGGPAVADRDAVGTALERVSGPAGAGVPAMRRLCAEYRLNVVEAGEYQRVEQPHHEDLPEPALPTTALSRRQHEVMALVSRGARNAEIAERLRVSEKTVKNHMNRIFRSLGAGSRIEAVLIWQRQQPDRRRAARRLDAPNQYPALAGGRPPAPGGTP